MDTGRTTFSGNLKAKKTVLTHLYPEWDDVIFSSVVERARPGCEILEARDGMTIEVSGGGGA